MQTKLAKHSATIKDANVQNGKEPLGVSAAHAQARASCRRHAKGMLKIRREPRMQLAVALSTNQLNI